MKFSSLLLCFVLAQAARAETVQSGILMARTPYQTPLFIKTGAETGPTIVVIGGLHGDEPAGYLAARELKKWTITRGKLVLVPDAHVAAIQRGVRAYPRNMNRLFPGKPNGDAMERLAFELWQLIKQAKPDLVLTLHESRGFHVDDPKRYGQTFTYDFPALKSQFERVAARVNARIAPKKQRFLQFIDPFPTCPTYVTYKYLRVPATSIETAKPLPLSTRISLQLSALRGFFDEWQLGYQTGPQVRPTPTASPTAGATPIEPLR
ncbi:MAG TPA: succinylglutamate desuccinylase/aspartoacylase family protein [Abditibacterium sp.]|jgi:hypothetical protein